MVPVRNFRNRTDRIVISTCPLAYLSWWHSSALLLVCCLHAVKHKFFSGSCLFLGHIAAHHWGMLAANRPITPVPCGGKCCSLCSCYQWSLKVPCCVVRVTPFKLPIVLGNLANPRGQVRTVGNFGSEILLLKYLILYLLDLILCTYLRNVV